MVRTNRSACAFKFGERGGNFTDSTPCTIPNVSFVERGHKYRPTSRSAIRPLHSECLGGTCALLVRPAIKVPWGVCA
jgi:hypothetical protein